MPSMSVLSTTRTDRRYAFSARAATAARAEPLASSPGMPSLDAIGIVSADLDRTRAFYALLGVEVAAGDDHVEATLPSGIRLMFDTEDVMRSFRPDWTP